MLLKKKGKNIIATVFLLGATLLSSCSKEIGYEYGESEMYEKVWESKVIHNESVVFVEDENGVKSATLLYTPTRIISVRNCTLEEEYSSDQFYFKDDKIYMSESGTMPYLTQANIDCSDVPSSIGGTYSSPKTNSGKILFTEGPGIFLYQTMVTYEHEDEWSGSIPKIQGDKFPNTYRKLEAGDPVTIVGYGASTLTGCNASSKFGMAPFQDSFFDAFVNSIRSKYKSTLTVYNNAQGGTTSQWGVENVQTAVQAYAPDLVIVEFGHNDACWNINKLKYEDNMDFIIRAIRVSNPNAEIILCASHMANPNSSQYAFQPDYLPILESLCSTFDGVALADLTTLTLDLQKKKSSFDMYANNINHPSDWLSRIFATVLMQTFNKE